MVTVIKILQLQADTFHDYLTDSTTFFLTFLQNISPFYGVTGTLVSDFWWHLSWFQSQSGTPCLHAFSLYMIDSSYPPLVQHLLWKNLWKKNLNVNLDHSKLSFNLVYCLNVAIMKTTAFCQKQCPIGKSSTMWCVKNISRISETDLTVNK